MFGNTQELSKLQSWKQKGFTDIVLFGRFQPLHKGHMSLLNTMRASGLNVNLVFNDKTDGAEGGERNPFNPFQRQEMAKMALDWLTDDNIRHANVYLGGGGDVGDAVRKLTGIFESIAPPEKLVFGYYEKEEDRKEYLVDGQIVSGVHYVELVGAPRGKFPVQKITEPMILEATGDYFPIDAKMFRNGIKQNDQVCYELLDDAVARYVCKEMTLADLNNRPVGACKSNDRFTLHDLNAALLTTTSVPLYSKGAKPTIAQDLKAIELAASSLLEREMA